jgi:hypothetical protein
MIILFQDMPLYRQPNKIFDLIFLSILAKIKYKLVYSFIGKTFIHLNVIFTSRILEKNKNVYN